MMTHPGMDTLIAHADGELGVDEERDIARHAAGCAACNASLAELRGTTSLFAGALHVLDGAAPADWRPSSVDAALKEQRIERPLPHRSEAGTTARTIPLQRRAVVRTAPRTLRWAAAIALVSAAAVSAAIIAERVGPRADPPVGVAPPASLDPAIATIVATPQGGVLHVALSGAGEGSRLHVTLADAAQSSVAVEGGDSPRFTAAAGNVAVDLRGSTAVVRVTVPAALRALTVTVDGAPLVISRAGVLTPTAAGTSGIPLDPAAGLRME